MLKNDVYDAVVKRACGYSAVETVEEYAAVDGSFELVKKRVTTKDVPPDIAAAKLILDDGDMDELTDEQLEAEKRRLLEELRSDDENDEK